jgi:hypothetical protein
MSSTSKEDASTQGPLEQSKTPLICHERSSAVPAVATDAAGTATDPITSRKPIRPKNESADPGKSTATTLKATPVASGKPSFFIQNAVALDPTIIANAAVAAANIWNPTYVPRPHFNDVIFPVEDYPMWIGNIKYRNEIIKRQFQFYNSVDRAEQAKLALEIVHSIQEQRPPGRFVLALKLRPPPTNTATTTNLIQVPENQKFPNKPVPGGFPPYLENTIFQVMNETDVLIQLGKQLRRVECHRVKRFIAKQKKHPTKRTNTTCTNIPKREKHQYVDYFFDTDEEDEYEENNQEEEDPLDSVPTKKVPIESLGPLQVLYYVPQNQQLPQKNKIQNYPTTGKHHDDAVSLQSSSSSSPLVKKRTKHTASKTMARRFTTNEPLSKKIRTGKAVMEYTAKHLDIVVPPPPSSSPFGMNNTASMSEETNNKTKEKPTKATSLMVLSQNEGTNILPKGVTVRPSGKWVRTSAVVLIPPNCFLIIYLLPTNIFICLLFILASTNLFCGTVSIRGSVRHERVGGTRVRYGAKLFDGISKETHGQQGYFERNTGKYFCKGSSSRGCIGCTFERATRRRSSTGCRFIRTG